MTIKIRNAGYFASGYDVMTMPVDVTDNEGMLCTRCNTDNVNACTVYGADKWNMSADLTVDCCVHCVPIVIRTVLHTELPVTVEMTGEAFLAAYLRVVDVAGFTAYDGPIPVAGWTGVRPVADPLLDLLAEPESDPWRDDRMAHPDDDRPHSEGA